MIPLANPSTFQVFGPTDVADSTNGFQSNNRDVRSPITREYKSVM